MKNLFFAIFVAIFTLVPSDVFGRNNARLVHRKVPQIFFHWISAESINKDKKTALVERGFLPLPRIYPDFKMVDAVPELAYSKGLFVWTHPVGGVGTGPEEIYGDLGALIGIKLKDRNYSVMEIESQAGSPPLHLQSDLRGVELIHHKHFDRVNGEKILIFEEWVIKKPRIAAEFTADPRSLGPLIRAQIDFMQRGGKYSHEEVHAKLPPNQRYSEAFVNSDFARQNYIIPRLEAYLQKRSSEFHPSWLKPFDACEALSLEYETM